MGIVLDREEEEQEVVLAAEILVGLSDKAWTDESVGVEECEGAMAGRGDLFFSNNSSSRREEFGGVCVSHGG